MHLVVTVPKSFWPQWILEGDAAGLPASGTEWAFSVGTKPPINPGDRLYIVAHGKLRGYAPVTRVVAEDEGPRWFICREGGAVAVTIPQPIPGFRGFRKVWWDPAIEVPFEDWKNP